MKTVKKAYSAPFALSYSVEAGNALLDSSPVAGGTTSDLNETTWEDSGDWGKF